MSGMKTATLQEIDGDLVIIVEHTGKVGVLGYCVQRRSQFSAGEVVTYTIVHTPYDEPYALIEKDGQRYNCFLEIYATTAILQEDASCQQQ